MKFGLMASHLRRHASLEVVNHSPTGFSWGYGGSGPAQLALAVLLELTDEASALASYQDFKWAVIARLPQSDFEIELNNTRESYNRCYQPIGTLRRPLR